MSVIEVHFANMKDHIFLSYNNLAHKNVMTSKLKNVSSKPGNFYMGK